jgi:hypothetical protein
MSRRVDDLAAIEVMDEEGRAVAVGSAWADQPALLVFIRHFG